ncbi:hypothetical protein [Ornithinimicrobium avium]|uniref:MinD-like ATPase involved in chromosome partitioning or flagellar assembly n=1 Tax=Ornithinimicrobium avium TaxID=2283195 RepID=A0A345NLV5_9MICO|nr:hypothetical protein [Ornithinimicrobium avium]AXH96013.1 hypothetical protein DV701_07625 [Ornithinimicrobium avium]
MTVISVAELRRAWHAVQDGRFRPGSTDLPSRRMHAPKDGAGEGVHWNPGVPVLPVLGCHGSAGATTVAAAVATALELAVRVVEAGPAGTSGLTGFATAELGETGSGWVRGHRDLLVLDRLLDGSASPEEIPVPDQDPHHELALNVLDAGWPTGTLLRCAGWVRSSVLDADRLVLVTTATVPGLRRLEAVLHDLDPAPGQVAVAVRGPRRRRWPREVTGDIGTRTRTLLEETLVEVPHDPGLAVRGLDTSPLPEGVLSAATTITQLLQLVSSPVHHQKGTIQHVR